jgi:Flp pilus assembly pilin Flp
MDDGTQKGPHVMGRQPNSSEAGQALVEYALVISLISLVCVGAVTLLGANVSTAINTMAGLL